MGLGFDDRGNEVRRLMQDRRDPGTARNHKQIGINFVKPSLYP
jgi:hypothetical protein